MTKSYLKLPLVVSCLFVAACATHKVKNPTIGDVMNQSGSETSANSSASATEVKSGKG